MKRIIQFRYRVILSLILVFSSASLIYAAGPVKIAYLMPKSGPLEVYAKQLIVGFNMGLEYATNGTNQVLGRPIQVIEYDTQLKPQRGRQLLEEAFRDERVDLAVGPAYSAVAMAVLPIAQRYRKILIVDGAATSITGKRSNRYIFRMGRNSDMDAVSIASALVKPGSVIATLAQDYAFGRDGVAAFKKVAVGLGGKIVHEEYAPPKTTNFTAPIQRIINAMEGQQGQKLLFVVWAGSNQPAKQIYTMQVKRKYGISMALGGANLDALPLYKVFEGYEGAGYYYYENPHNAINDWLVREHTKRYNRPPDFFTCQGMVNAMAIVNAINSAGSTKTEALISALEGMKFQTPKGEMYVRPEDHQALQSMYHFKIRVDPKVKWAIPELVKELTWRDMNIPIHK